MRFWGRSDELGVVWDVGLRKTKVINGQWFSRPGRVRQSCTVVVRWKSPGHLSSTIVSSLKASWLSQIKAGFHQSKRSVAHDRSAISRDKVHQCINLPRSPVTRKGEMAAAHVEADGGERRSIDN